MRLGWALRLFPPMVTALMGCGSPPQDPPPDAVRVAPGVWYTLEDGEQYHRDAPATFEIPPRDERDHLRPEQIVKLMFRIRAGDDDLVERMWVIVTGREPGGYVGTLDNQPLSAEAMRPGLTVRFEPRHVISIHKKTADHPN